MADFGKLNFSVAFNPTSALPLDARCYFTSLEAAQAAAATAEEVGSTNTVYYYGQKLLVDDGQTVTWYTIQRGGALKAESSADIADTVSLVVEVEGETYALDNAADPQPTEDPETYSVEINQ